MNFLSHKIQPQNHFLGMLLAFFFLLASYTLLVQVVFAGPQPNIYDGLVGHENTVDPADDATWGSNFGWVSFNNCSEPNNCSGITYGANLDLTTGLLTGHGWSSNLGWISFEPGDVAVCGAQAKLANNPNPSALFKGWGRAVVAPTGSGVFWNGCISMSYLNGGTSPQYGVRYDSQTGNITGQAWGGELIGWLNFAAHMPTDQPFINFFANPGTIQPGQTTQLEWNMTDIASCVAQPHPYDPNWNSSLQIDIPMVSPFQTVPHGSNTTYYMDCTTLTGQVIDNVAAPVVVSGAPILLGGPVVSLPDQNGNFQETITWQSNQDFQSCDLYMYDNNGTFVSSTPVPNITAGIQYPWQVSVNYNPTTFQIECQVQGQLQINATSNSHDIYQDLPVPVVEFKAQSCVVNETDPAWIAWNTEDVIYQDCDLYYTSLDGSQSGMASLDDPSGIWGGASAGTYSLVCYDPISGAPIQDQSLPAPDVIQFGGPSCQPTLPPGTPDPTIIFEEF